MTKIEIFDTKPNNALDFRFSSVLEGLDLEGSRMRWFLKNIEAVGPDILALEAKVAQHKDGLQMTWDELTELARKIEQVIDLDLIGYLNDDSSFNLGQRPDITICVEDSTFWSVTTDIDRVLSWVRQSFKECYVMDAA